MKLPFKYIAILVIVSLAGIFAYQAYWLTGLYQLSYSGVCLSFTACKITALFEKTKRIRLFFELNF